MYHDLKNIFHILIMFQCFFFASLLFALGKKRSRSNLLLAGFLIARAAAELGGVFFHFRALREALYAHLPHLFWIDVPFDFLYAPFLYLYVLSLTEKDFSLKKKHLVHASMAVLALVYILMRFELRGAETLRAFLTAESRFPSIEGDILLALMYLQTFGYTIAGLVTLRQHRRRIQDVFSSIEPVSLSWLKAVFCGFTVWITLSMIEYGLWLLIGSRPVIYFLYMAAEITFLLFLCVLFVRGLRQPEIFTGEIATSLRRKYEKTLIPSEAREAYRRQLAAVMETEKPFLDPLLSLPDLAKKVGLPPHQLSQVINTSFGKNFFDFVNSYRIEESRRLLARTMPGERTILDIIYETGFNSKSVFNTVFKKYTGMTPSEYQRQARAS